MKHTIYFSILIFAGMVHTATAQQSYKQMAQEHATNVAKSAQERAINFANTAQAKAMKQFNESYERFKLCASGKCTKGQAVKAARDLGIAAVAVISGMYIFGGALRKGATYMHRAGRQLQRPGKFVYEKASRVVYPFQKGDFVKYRGVHYDVKSYNQNGDLELYNWQTERTISVKPELQSEIEMRESVYERNR